MPQGVTIWTEDDKLFNSMVLATIEVMNDQNFGMFLVTTVFTNSDALSTNSTPVGVEREFCLPRRKAATFSGTELPLLRGRPTERFAAPLTFKLNTAATAKGLVVTSTGAVASGLRPKVNNLKGALADTTHDFDAVVSSVILVKALPRAELEVSPTVSGNKHHRPTLLAGHKLTGDSDAPETRQV